MLVNFIFENNVLINVLFLGPRISPPAGVAKPCPPRATVAAPLRRQSPSQPPPSESSRSRWPPPPRLPQSAVTEGPSDGPARRRGTDRRGCSGQYTCGQLENHQARSWPWPGRRARSAAQLSEPPSRRSESSRARRRPARRQGRALGCGCGRRGDGGRRGGGGAGAEGYDGAERHVGEAAAGGRDTRLGLRTNSKGRLFCAGDR